MQYGCVRRGHGLVPLSDEGRKVETEADTARECLRGPEQCRAVERPGDRAGDENALRMPRHAQQVRMVEHGLVRGEHRGVGGSGRPQVAHHDASGRQRCAHGGKKLTCREGKRDLVIGERIEYDQVVGGRRCTLDERAAVAGMHGHALVGCEAEVTLRDSDDDGIDLHDVDERVRQDLSRVHRHCAAAQADEEQSSARWHECGADHADACVGVLQMHRTVGIDRALTGAPLTRVEGAQPVASFGYTYVAELRVGLEDGARALIPDDQQQQSGGAGGDDGQAGTSHQQPSRGRGCSPAVRTFSSPWRRTERSADCRARPRRISIRGRVLSSPPPAPRPPSPAS